MMSWKVALFHMLAEVEALLSSDNDRIFWRRNELRAARIEFGKEIYIGRSFRIQQSGGIKLGERFEAGANLQLVNWARIDIGDDFMCSDNLVVNSGTHLPLTLQPVGRPVRIGDRVWVGTNVTVLASVTIGDDVVIGAGSLVNRDIPSNSIAVGVPARVIKRLDRSVVQAIWTWSRSGLSPNWRRLHEEGGSQ
jgi:acetyltransferase-like isoleucine patch superfamily enzyme